MKFTLFNKQISRKTNIISTIMFVLLTFIDQLTKYLASHYLSTNISIIPNALELHYLENRGAAWGILQGKQWFLIPLTIIILFALFFAYNKIGAIAKFNLLRYSLIIISAGAIGNLIDRIIHHYVVDFIYVSLINFPVFNIADCYVCIGAFLIAFCMLFKYKDSDFEREEVNKNDE